MWCTKGTVTHEESDAHKEIVNHGEIENWLNEIWFKMKIVREVSQIFI